MFLCKADRELSTNFRFPSAFYKTFILSSSVNSDSPFFTGIFHRNCQITVLQLANVSCFRIPLQTKQFVLTSS